MVSPKNKVAGLLWILANDIFLNVDTSCDSSKFKDSGNWKYQSLTLSRIPPEISGKILR